MNTIIFHNYCFQCELTEEFEKNPLLFTLIQPFLSTGESQSQAFMTKS